MVAIQEWDMTGDEAENCVLTRIEMLIAHCCRFNTCVDQESSKDKMRPDGAVDNYLLDAEEDHPKDDSPTDAIEQWLVFKVIRRAEDLEDDVEEEQAIDGQHPLQHVCGGPIDGSVRTTMKINSNAPTEPAKHPKNGIR